jgi:hypothetical protein
MPPPVPAVHDPPAVGCIVGQGAGGVSQIHVSVPIAPVRRQPQVVVP